MTDFFRTMMGRTFFEGTLPSLVRELARLNDNLEKDREQRERSTVIGRAMQRSRFGSLRMKGKVSP